MSAALNPEWERIEILGAGLVASRRGQSIPEHLTNRLSSLQRDIQLVRSQDPWRSLVNKFKLDPIDQDILACVIAPEAEPKIGWMYQELQPGIRSNYPTPALIREILFSGASEAIQYRQRLHRSSPLVEYGLIKVDKTELFHPVMPGEKAFQFLFGWNVKEQLVIPGAVHVKTNSSWDDLILPQHCIRKIDEFTLWIKHRKQVINLWGGRSKGGPVALFAGASGTGKTFAAEVIAHQFNMPLYRVDLGLLVSKYIGETEKNLNSLFDSADGQKIILLFDEADSLFGKRGEVKDARDRYANMEVSHLLSRIERHQGPCILTSNLRTHLDSAFTRRFQVVIDFPRPDELAREKLWKLHIPAKAPLDSNVDISQVAKAVQLTGGQIRNAALHAAFLAADEESRIQMKHFAQAVWTELLKEGGERQIASLGELMPFLPKEESIAKY